jgi:hypothetical protein
VFLLHGPRLGIYLVRALHESVIAPLASGVVVGPGSFGCRLAAWALMRLSAPAPHGVPA